MMNDNTTVSLTLLDKEYQVACPPQEQDALRRAARSLDARLRAIRGTGGVVGVERIAIMAALNLSYELQTLSEKSSTSALDDTALSRLCEKVDSALSNISR